MKPSIEYGPFWRNNLIGWAGGLGLALLISAVVTALGLWPRDPILSFLLGLLLGWGLPMAGLGVVAKWQFDWFDKEHGR